MNKENKDLLLRDLCARLSYGVKICYIFNEEECVSTIEKIDTFGYIWDNYNGCYHVREIKPYLFPLSSISEDQKYDFYCRFIENDCNFDDFKKFYLYNGMWRRKLLTSLYDIEAIIEWFHKNHIDYRGLIEKGLAIDATDLNIY